MKKFLSIILCLVFVFCLAACGDNPNKADIAVDIEYYASLGQISDLDYKLGDSIDDVKAALSLSVDDHGDPTYFDYTSGEYTVLTDGTLCCCYKTDNADDGITCIVKYGEAYGFIVGAVSTQVRDTMADMGYTATERDAKNGELFFLPGDGFTVLEYEIKDNTVLFVFQEHTLAATVIYD